MQIHSQSEGSDHLCRASKVKSSTINELMFLLSIKFYSHLKLDVMNRHFTQSRSGLHNMVRMRSLTRLCK